MMNTSLINRNDLLAIFNHARFRLRHFARGSYPTNCLNLMELPVNRMFFPLNNPNGGANFIQDEERKRVFFPGMLYFIPAYYPVRMVLDGELEFLSIQTNLEIFPGVELFSGCRGFLELPAPPEREILLNICGSSTDPFAGAVRAGASALNILASLIKHFPPEDFWRPLALKEYAKLTDFLEKRGNARTAVKELAALEGESREGFTRHFTLRTGITPKQLIDRFVISRCLTLLEDGRSFKEIAQELQFSSEFVFSRYFKRNIGVSPLAWKKRCRKNEFHLSC